MTDTKKNPDKAGTTVPGAAAPAKVSERTIADQVLSRINAFVESGSLRLPPNYSPENAIKSAYLILLEAQTKDGKPVLEVCTKESIANAMLKMVIQGLDPIKKQCDFIAYGTKLTMQREYHGTILLAKRNGGIEEPKARIVYEGDEFQYHIDENGNVKIVKHEQTLENIDMNKIRGAYAIVHFQDKSKTPHVEIMTMAQIRQSWQQGATNGNSPAHRNFPDQMAAKTVIGRACKLFISSSDDSALFDDDEPQDHHAAQAKSEARNNANREEITMDIAAVEVKDRALPEAAPKGAPTFNETNKSEPVKQQAEQESRQPAQTLTFDGPEF